MVELTADRLVLVDSGTAREYAGSMEDYIDFVLGRNQPKPAKKPSPAKPKPAPAGVDRAKLKYMQSELTKAEKALAKLATQAEQMDREIADLAARQPTADAGRMENILARRAKLTDRLEQAEAQWLAAGEALEGVAQL